MGRERGKGGNLVAFSIDRLISIVLYSYLKRKMSKAHTRQGVDDASVYSTLRCRRNDSFEMSGLVNEKCEPTNTCDKKIR